MKNNQQLTINNSYVGFKRGFTLLEMLVVIGIIAILVGMGAVSYSSAQKKARDARRKVDLANIRNAMEQYYSLCYSSYPAAAAGSKVPGSIATLLATPCTIATTIMATTPTDPKTGLTYTYNSGATPPTLCAQPSDTPMESETSTYCVNLQQ